VGATLGALAITAALTAAGPAGAAVSKFPAGGSDFAVDAQGWTGSQSSCEVPSSLVCSASTPYESGVGSPAGSISTRVDLTVNLLGLLEGSGTWTSPAFTVPAGAAVTGASFEYRRQLDPGGLLDLTPRSDVAVSLVDQTTGNTATLLKEQLGTGVTTFAKRGVGAPEGALVAGHTYRVRIATTTTTTVARLGVLGQTNTRFDDVALAIQQGSDGSDGDSDGGGGGTTPMVSPGVTISSDALSTSQINALFGRFNENTEVGPGPGGSLVPVARCTIVGTPSADRIKGTLGNDVICGLGGNDVINGAGGIDIIDGANGRDRLKGSSASDKIIALRGNDRIVGNAGNDRLGGGAGRDRVTGSAGADRIGGGSSNDTVTGSGGRDRLNAGKGRDRLNGGKGGDRILGGSGNDRIRARDRARDNIDGGRGRDRATVDRPSRGGRRTRGLRRPVDRVRRVERQR
jgi:Ca2+-binding RTX toxin-like protein